MIPKASGGSRPEDQRPITVLEVLYRIWAKGVTLEWRATLQAVFLGDAAMGFRSHKGTKHMVQLLSDIIALQRRDREELFFLRLSTSGSAMTPSRGRRCSASYAGLVYGRRWSPAWRTTPDG